MASILTTLVALAQQVKVEVEQNGLLCFCGVIPGDSAAIEYAGECGEADGMAWVRIAQAYPATGVGLAAQRPGVCGVGTGYDIEVGSMRSITVTEEAPEATEVLAWVEQQDADMNALRRAIQCGVVLNQKDYILGNFTPIGPQGGMVGGAWTVFVMVD